MLIFQAVRHPNLFPKNIPMGWKGLVQEYLTFTRKDRVGILVLVSIIILVIFLPPLLPSIRKNVPAQNDSSALAALDTVGSERSPTYHKTFRQPEDKEDRYHSPERPKQLFYFNPNTVSVDNWKKLGIRDKTIQTIKNYLDKGGHFKKAEDLKRVYGLHADEYERLEPYVRIEQAVAIPNVEEIKFSSPKSPPTRYSIIDINTADTSAFISLPGIGSKLAARIVNFRDKLGGFYSIEQVRETFGLPDSTFQNIRQSLKLGDRQVKKININTATLDDLKAFPYLRYNIANPIIAYRNEHGPFTKVEDIKKVMVVTDSLFAKIFPYLKIEN